MKTPLTINGVSYLAFDNLPGVRDSHDFRTCARRVATLLTDLLVLQDDFRRGLTPSLESKPEFLTPKKISKELMLVSAAFAKMRDEFPDVFDAYNQSPKPDGCWRESVYGAIVSLALRVKQDITTMQKTGTSGILFGQYDVPPTFSIEEIVNCMMPFQDSNALDSSGIYGSGESADSRKATARQIALDETEQLAIRIAGKRTK